MKTLSHLYHPVTGTPFQQDETYREVAPCAALAPCIRCFWGSEGPQRDRPGPAGIVIPDTCMDIIFRVDHVRQRVSADFCALDESSFITPPSDGLTGGFSATFAIRFYAWTACLFAGDDLRGSANRQYPAEQFFGRIVRALAPVLPEARTLEDAIRLAEPVLVALLDARSADPVILNAVHRMLQTSGCARVGDIAAALALSPRQLERRFDAAMGLSPKALSSLIRYQLLWQDMLYSPRFSVLDAVDRFGYADQAHLLNDFRRRHLMSPREALAFARR
ncbi:MAG: AraC family transcriptional regulator [Clostridia bacterium]|nr:AraC family transcriptional regulator [Clostridia bacterium]